MIMADVMTAENLIGRMDHEEIASSWIGDAATTQG